MEMLMKYFGKLKLGRLLIIQPLLIIPSRNIDTVRLKFKQIIGVIGNLPILWLNSQPILSEKANPLASLIEIVDINLLWVQIDKQFIV